MATRKPKQPLTAAQESAKILNAFHDKHCHGFYGRIIGGRYFMARASADGQSLEVSPDFGMTWCPVARGTQFQSAYGTHIVTPY